MSKLFSPITFQSITLKNRIVMSPMCMYSSVKEDGHITDFHMTHYTSRAIGGVGLVTVEATSVKEEGRISPQDLGIWNDAHVDGFKKLNEQIHQYGAKSAIQLAHAGRKAVLPSEIYAPSPIAFNENSKVPAEMTIRDIKDTIEAFRYAAIRAKIAGFDIIEIHAAHGYLLNQFLSPLTNHRKDNYGGNRENRYRIVKEIIDGIKSVWSGPLFIRISTDEYDEEGNSFEDIHYFTVKMKEQGIDLIDCSSGGVVPVRITSYPGYQIKRAEKIKQMVNIATGAVGLISTGIQGEEIIQNERADLVFIGRALLKNPYWPKAAADELNFKLEAPKQYERGWN